MEGEYKVTLVIFSGVPDPVWTVRSDHAKFEEMKKLLGRAKSDGKTHRHRNIPPHLGFRGFLLNYPGSAEYGDLILGRETKALQQLLLSTMPEGLIPDSLRQKVSKAIESDAVSPIVPDDSQGSMAAPIGKTTAVHKIQHYAPERNLPRWNKYTLIRFNNNCYNYANDKITNSFAQPGQASGHPITSITAENAIESAISDGWLKMDVPPSAPVPEAPEQPNCLVALFVAVGVDYHCYRLDNDGYWSQKLGGTAATNLDGDGKTIKDPRTAVNNPIGPDYKFVTFMQIFTNIIDGPITP